MKMIDNLTVEETQLLFNDMYISGIHYPKDGNIPKCQNSDTCEIVDSFLNKRLSFTEIFKFKIQSCLNVFGSKLYTYGYNKWVSSKKFPSINKIDRLIWDIGYKLFNYRGLYG